MLRNTFIHLPGVGAHRERTLWKQGILDWDRFRDAYEGFTKLGSIVIGVIADSLDRHQAFAASPV